MSRPTPAQYSNRPILCHQRRCTDRPAASGYWHLLDVRYCYQWTTQLKSGTHWRQSRHCCQHRRQIGDKVNCRLCRRFVADTFDFVANLSLVCRKSTVAGSFDFVDPIAVDIVAKVEHLQLGRKWVIFVARMSNVLSTVASVYVASVYGAKATRSTFSTFDKVDMSNSTLEPVCTGLQPLTISVSVSLNAITTTSLVRLYVGLSDVDIQGRYIACYLRSMVIKHSAAELSLAASE